MRLLVFLPLFVGMATRIDAAPTTAVPTTDELISRLKKSPNHLAIVQQLRRKGDRKAIPALEHAFEQVSKEDERLTIAAALVSLKSEKVKFWNLLKERGEAAANSDIPYPLAVDENGQYIRGKLSQDFLEWCKAHKVDSAKATKEALYEAPGVLLAVGLTEDSRATPILKKGLTSPNVALVLAAAKGLARMGDKSAAPQIISALERLPKGASRGLGEVLLYFDDPQAEQAGRNALGNSELADEIINRKRQKGVKALLGDQ